MIRTLVTDLGKFWGNGTRALMVAFLIFIATLIALIAVTITAFYISRGREFRPLDYQNPQHVVNPIVRPGEPVIVEAYKCNTSGQPIAVEGHPYYRNLDTQALVSRPGARLDSYVLPDGCIERRFENAIPADLPPGRYQLEGVDEATKGERIQREAWYTDEFCLTGASGDGC